MIEGASSSLRDSVPDPSIAAVRGAVLAAAILGLISTLGATLYLVTQGIGGEPLPLRVAISWQALLYGAWIPIAGVVGWLLAKSAERGERVTVTLLRLTLFGVIAVPTHGLISAAATRWMRGLLNPDDIGAGIATRLLADLPTQILQYWALVAALMLLASRTRLRERERTAERLTADLNAARLEQLRARLQPHFLFNTLQSIAMLIPKDPDSAQRMTIQLGDLLRASLRSERTMDGRDAKPDGQMVTLRDELALLRCYLDIEAQRFRDRLRVEWQVDNGTLDMSVPDLLLQPLVENALKHGL
ncbi:MAG: histidine kinase, partial [Phycisphaerae bacterium]|nr:histidine kinase [Gemmatimonadaceae bacterium]